MTILMRISTISAWLLIGVLGLAVAGKAHDPGAFASDIRSVATDPVLARLLFVVVPTVELATVCLLVDRQGRVVGFVMSLVIMCVFTAYLMWRLRAMGTGCHCFGRWDPFGSNVQLSIARNVLLSFCSAVGVYASPKL